MTDANICTNGGVLRRPGHIYVTDLDGLELPNVGQGYGTCSSESSYSAGEESADRINGFKRRDRRSSSGNSSEKGLTVVPGVDLGGDVRGLFPTSTDEIANQVSDVLRATNRQSSEIGDGRPGNFGVVLPGLIYRSSFPKAENYKFIESLDLNTVITLVDKDYPPGYTAFLESRGIRHIVIDMKGTKKVAIDEQAVMHPVLKAALSKENHPCLIHCNHGKHRTGCVVAVIRHIAGWKIGDIIEEYAMFAGEKIRDVDIKYISQYDITGLKGLLHQPLIKATLPTESTSGLGSGTGSARSQSIKNDKRCRFLVGGMAFLLIFILLAYYFMD